MKLWVALFIFCGHLKTASAQPVGQSATVQLCAQELKASGNAGHATIEDNVSAYKYVLGEVGAVDVKIEELQAMLDGSNKNLDTFFKLKENGTVVRGQIQSALHEIRKQSLGLDHDSFIEALTKTVREIILSKSSIQKERGSAIWEVSQVNRVRILNSKMRNVSKIFHTKNAAVFTEIAWSIYSTAPYGWDYNVKSPVYWIGEDWQIAKDIGASIWKVLDVSYSANFILLYDKMRSQIVRRNLITGEQVDVFGPCELDKISVSLSSDGKTAVIGTNRRLLVWSESADGVTSYFPVTVADLYLFDSIGGRDFPSHKIKIIPGTQENIFIEKVGRTSSALYVLNRSAQYSKGIVAIPIIEKLPRWVVSAESNVLATLSSSGSLTVFRFSELDSVQKLGSVSLGAGPPFTGPLDVSPNGHKIAVGIRDSSGWRVSIRNVDNSLAEVDVIRTPGVNRYIDALSFLPDNSGLLVAVKSSSGTQIWLADLNHKDEQ